MVPHSSTSAADLPTRKERGGSLSRAGSAVSTAAKAVVVALGGGLRRLNRAGAAVLRAGAAAYRAAARRSDSFMPSAPVRGANRRRGSADWAPCRSRSGVRRIRAPPSRTDAAVQRPRIGTPVLIDRGTSLVAGNSLSIGVRSALCTSAVDSPTFGSARLSTIERLRVVVTEQVEHVEREPRVLQRRDLRRRDQHVVLCRVEGLEHVLGELRRGVDDDVVVARAQLREQLADHADRHAFGVARVDRCEHAVEPRLVRGDQGGDRRVVGQIEARRRR